MKDKVQPYIETLQAMVKAADEVEMPEDEAQRIAFVKGMITGSGQVAKLMIKFLEGIE